MSKKFSGSNFSTFIITMCFALFGFCAGYLLESYSPGISLTAIVGGIGSGILRDRSEKTLEVKKTLDSFKISFASIISSLAGLSLGVVFFHPVLIIDFVTYILVLFTQMAISSLATYQLSKKFLF